MSMLTFIITGRITLKKKKFPYPFLLKLPSRVEWFSKIMYNVLKKKFNTISAMQINEIWQSKELLLSVN